MLLKNSTVLSCFLPARLGFGSHPRPDSPPRTRDQEKRTKDDHHLDEPELDPFRGNASPLYQAAYPPDLSRAYSHPASSNVLSPPPDGGIGESPGPPNRSLGPSNRLKRSSCTTFFAFSSKRKSVHGAPIVHIPHLQQDLLVPSHTVSGRWAPGSGKTQAHLINPSSLPSPLQTDDEEYYYSYYTSLSHSALPRPDSTTIPPSKPHSSRQQDPVGNPDLDSQRSSPVDFIPSHTHIHHPYAYSTPLSSVIYPQTIDISPPLRHTASQPLQHHLQDSPSDFNMGLAHDGIPPSQHRHAISKSQPDHLQPRLKTSMSVPNLASEVLPARSRSYLKKRPLRSKGQERWLSAETWWDALLSPSPRFKVKAAPRPQTTTNGDPHDTANKPVQGQPKNSLGVTFPSVPAPRPRAVSATSVTSHIRAIRPALTRSRSIADLPGQPLTSVTPRPGFEPALETLVDESVPASDQASSSEAELFLPDPPPSLAQVIDDGEAFEQQRAQWRQQASKSLGNKRSRSFSRARSKSLGSKRSHNHHTPESSRTQLNLEFLAARTLLGSQSTMPTVHVTRPSDASSHSKSYSHSHSQSAYSHSQASNSRAYSHSHSHSHSLTTNSSKSSRNPPPRGHSRTESWSKTAFLKAGVLCGIGQDDSFSTSEEEKIPSSSRVDVQGMVHMGDSSTNPERPSDTAKVSLPQSIPSGEVGIAITSSLLEGCFDLKVPGHPYVCGPQHREGEQESRRSPNKSFEYAGPHPSAVDSSLPQLGATSGVSLRHRLPPRATIHPPVSPIAHPYRSALVQPGQVDDESNEDTAQKITKGRVATELNTTHTSYPHISLSHADFEQYGVGEALVYASCRRSKEVPEADVGSELSPANELPSPDERSSCETDVLQSEELDGSSSTIDSLPPSLTNSTIQMVVSALDNPDDLEEFQDLFYKPYVASKDQPQEPSSIVNQVPTDVHSSTSSSPLTHLVRKLSEVCSRQDPPWTPSDPTQPQGSGPQDPRPNEGTTKFVFMDLARTSSSPVPLESTSQTHLPIQKGGESTVQPVMVIPEDVDSSYSTSILESLTEESENDTFGYSIKQGQLETTTAPDPIQPDVRVSTHLSIQDENERDGGSFLSPETEQHGLYSDDIIRSSYLTTSDLSQISALSDFPLPPSARPSEPLDQMSVLQTYFTATPSFESQSHSQRESKTEMNQGGQHTDGEEDTVSSGDADDTLRSLRMSRVTSFESHGSTFGGCDGMDPVTQSQQACS